MTIDNPGTGTMGASPSGTITGFSKTCSVTAVGVTTTRASASQVYLTSTGGPFTAADVCTIGYSSATGNYKNGDGVELLATGPFPVTNQITAGTPTLTQTAVGCYVPNVPEADFSATAWLALPNEGCELPSQQCDQRPLAAHPDRWGVQQCAAALLCRYGGTRYRVEADYGGPRAPLRGGRGDAWHDIDGLPVSRHGELWRGASI